MSSGEPTVEQVRADLAARIGLIDARVSTAKPGDLAREIDLIRSIAHRGGLRPAVTVAQALEAALARGERGPLIRGWLSILRDAIASDQVDSAACATYAAACSVRLTG